MSPEPTQSLGRYDSLPVITALLEGENGILEASWLTRLAEPEFQVQGHSLLQYIRQKLTEDMWTPHTNASTQA